MKTIQMVVSGKVQHVGFRACTKRIALSLGVCGAVKNLPDGTVEITASGDQAILDKFIAMIHACPRVVIREVEVKALPPRAFSDFCILREISQ
ncbi:acylphosphatase [uncultured Methanofollis sp.]|uniref:acylphosphatase n=1 Tax=uncultured Methanofollis sp. TaxID=262500 RepID=UPI00261462FC|nr:acylphosphatase [uncultured Methanofollis sp.]